MYADTTPDYNTRALSTFRPMVPKLHASAAAKRCALKIWACPQCPCSRGLIIAPSASNHYFPHDGEDDKSDVRKETPQAKVIKSCWFHNQGDIMRGQLRGGGCLIIDEGTGQINEQYP